VLHVCRSATAMVVIEALEQARHSFGLPQHYWGGNNREQLGRKYERSRYLRKEW
jgi:hypothetical protein